MSLRSLALLSVLMAPLALAEGEAAWPGKDWSVVPPADAGVDGDRLEEALDFAGERHSRAVVVVRGGRIVGERYWEEWEEETTGPLHSATKSLTAVLVEMAIEDGHLHGLDQRSSELLKEWKGTPKEAITVRHHLTMTTGLEITTAGRTILEERLARDERAHATGLGLQAAPGTEWAYHNAAYRLLFSILEEATGQSLEAYSKARLFDPIGITTAAWKTKPRGRAKNIQTLECSARDFARFGLLVLRKGMWKDRRLVSEEFLKEATTPSQELNPSYGYLWWLNSGKGYLLPSDRPGTRPHGGELLPGCPKDVAAALGANDQKLYVVPSLDLVVVRLGERAFEKSRIDDAIAPSDFDGPFLRSICESVRD